MTRSFPGIGAQLGRFFFCVMLTLFTLMTNSRGAMSGEKGVVPMKSLGRSILITKDVADLLGVPLDDLGEHELRGLTAPVSIYAPKVSMSDP